MNVKQELEKIGFKDITKEFEHNKDFDLDILELELPNGGRISVSSGAGWDLDEYDLNGGRFIEITIKTNSGYELIVN
jgi:hypothetical protein